MDSDFDRLTIEEEAEAERLSGVFVRILLLAKASQLEFEAAGRAAVAKGEVAAADWTIIREATGGR
jgi:hypothetical protein